MAGPGLGAGLWASWLAGCWPSRSCSSSGPVSRADELLGLPELEVSGLRDVDARALLDSVTHSPLDHRIRDRIVAETRGNPLALLELPRGLSMTQMAGGFGLLRPDTLPGRIEQSFLTRIEALPEPTRLLLLVAAAEPRRRPGSGVARC